MSPTTGDGGFAQNDVFIPNSQPVGYTPQKGDLGVIINRAMYPIEHMVRCAANGPDVGPRLVGTVRNGYSYPGFQQYGAAVSEPDLVIGEHEASWIQQQYRTFYPFFTASPKVQFGVRVLDTEPDATTADDRDDPNYKPNPGLQMFSQTHYDFPATQTCSASNDSGKLLLTFTTEYASWTMVRFTSTGTLPTELQVDTNYWLVRASSTTAWVATSMMGVSTNTVVAWGGAGSGTHTINSYVCDDEDGVGYLWGYQEAMIEWRIVQVNRFAWRLFIRSPNSSDTILYSLANVVPVTPYPGEGILFETPKTDIFIFAKLSGSGVSYQFAPNTGQYQSRGGMAPTDDVLYSFSKASGQPFQCGPRPHPALRVGQTTYAMQTPTVKVGTDFDGTPFSPCVGKISGALKTQAYKMGMYLAYLGDAFVSTSKEYPTYTTSDPTFGLFTMWGASGLYGVIPTIAKIGKAIATWTASTQQLALTTPTSDPIIRWRAGTDPSIISQTTAYGGTSPSAYFTTGTTNPGLADGDAIILTGSAPLPFFPSLSTAQQCVFFVRDSQLVSGSYYFNLASVSGDVAVVPAEAKTFDFMRTYTGAITLSTSATISFYVTRGCMMSSDEFSVAVMYADEAPPADFTESFWSVPPTTEATVDNNTKTIAIDFQRRANWYVSPGGTGTGLTPDSPDKLEDVCGYSLTSDAYWYVAKWGKAVGCIRIGLLRNSLGKYEFTFIGDLKYDPIVSGLLSKLYYGINTTPGTLYTAAIIPTNTSELQFVVRDTDTSLDRTSVFKQVVTGTSDPLVATWTLSTKTLVISGIPDYAGIDLVGGTETYPTTTIARVGGTATIVLSAPITLRLRLAFEDKDISFNWTDVQAVNAIDPDSTADFVQNLTMTWQYHAFYNQFSKYFERAADVVWACEGTYDLATDNKHYWVKPDIILRGGFNEAYTQRDTDQLRSILVGQRQTNGNLSFAASIVQGRDSYYSSWATLIEQGIVDGFWSEWRDTTAMLQTPLFKCMRANDCHVEKSQVGAASGTVTVFPTAYANGGAGLFDIGKKPLRYPLPETTPLDWLKYTYCTVDLDLDWSAAGLTLTVDAFPDPNNFRFGSADHCDVLIRAVSGNGTDGIPGSSYPSYFGGNASCTVNVLGIGDDCTIDVEATSGRGGHAATSVDGYGGNGGNTTCAIALGYSGAGTSGRIMNRTSLRAIATTGDGGNGGAGSVDPYWGGPGGRTTVSVNVAASARQTSYIWPAPNAIRRVEELRAIGGDHGLNGLPDPGYSQTCSAQVTSQYCGEDPYRLVGEYESHSGACEVTAPTSLSQSGIVVSPLGYIPTITAEASAGYALNTQLGYFSCGVTPCYIDPALLSITEQLVTGNANGHPKRVNAFGTATAWYSGTPNSNGAPLTGYETPKGTGIALGRYWE